MNWPEPFYSTFCYVNVTILLFVMGKMKRRYSKTLSPAFRSYLKKLSRASDSLRTKQSIVCSLLPLVFDTPCLSTGHEEFRSAMFQKCDKGLLFLYPELN